MPAMIGFTPIRRPDHHRLRHRGGVRGEEPAEGLGRCRAAEVVAFVKQSLQDHRGEMAGPVTMFGQPSRAVGLDLAVTHLQSTWGS
jgi:hypothetical protein